MHSGYKPLNMILLKCFGAVLTVHILCVPVFYIYNRYTAISGWYYATATIIKFVFILSAVSLHLFSLCDRLV